MSPPPPRPPRTPQGGRREGERGPAGWVLPHPGPTTPRVLSTACLHCAVRAPPLPSSVSLRPPCRSPPPAFPPSGPPSPPLTQSSVDRCGVTGVGPTGPPPPSQLCRVPRGEASERPLAADPSQPPVPDLPGTQPLSEGGHGQRPLRRPHPQPQGQSLCQGQSWSVGASRRTCLGGVRGPPRRPHGRPPGWRRRLGPRGPACHRRFHS